MKIQPKFLYFFPIPYSKKEINLSQLFNTLQKGIETNYNETEVVVVGNIPKEVETFAAKAPMGAIRWWPMESHDSLEACIRYAKYCASGKEKIVITL